jgi:hypothetical protein
MLYLSFTEHDQISDTVSLLYRIGTAFAQTATRSVLPLARPAASEALTLQQLFAKHLNSSIKSPYSSHPSLLNPLPNIIRRRLPFPIPQVLHLVRRHQASFHATAQVALAQLATLGRVDSTSSLEAAEVLLHERLAFGVVVQREGALCGRVGAADFDAGAGGAKGGHFGGWVLGEVEGGCCGCGWSIGR